MKEGMRCNSPALPGLFQSLHNVQECGVTPSQGDGSGRNKLLTTLIAPSFLPEGALSLPASVSVGKGEGKSPGL